MLLNATGGGGALATVGGGLLGGGADTTTLPDPGEVVGGLELVGDCGAYQGCNPTDCIQAILSHLIVCQSSVTKPPVSPAQYFQTLIQRFHFSLNKLDSQAMAEYRLSKPNSMLLTRFIAIRLQN